MTSARSGWRLERTVQRPTSNASGGHGAVTIEVFWSNRPLPRQACLLEPEAVGCP
jgi:DNA adenine methylase